MPKSIASNRRKQILNSLLLFFGALEFQYSMIQIGVKKPVKITMDKDRPSIPKCMLKLGIASHVTSWTNWNCVFVVSNNVNKNKHQLKMISDKNSESPLMRIWLFLSIKKIRAAPNKGRVINTSNIEIGLRFWLGRNLLWENSLGCDYSNNRFELLTLSL